MEFEFDAVKSASNKSKHGIDFVEAQKLWDDVDRVEWVARFEDEPRKVIVGKIAEKHWAAIVTHRNDKIRIISVRRARKEEVGLYESERV